MHASKVSQLSPCTEAADLANYLLLQLRVDHGPA